jgi:hypothetical protein
MVKERVGAGIVAAMLIAACGEEAATEGPVADAAGDIPARDVAMIGSGADGSGNDGRMVDQSATGWDGPGADVPWTGDSAADAGIRGPTSDAVGEGLPDALGEEVTDGSDAGASDVVALDGSETAAVDAIAGTPSCGPKGAEKGWVETIATTGTWVTTDDPAVWIDSGLFVFRASSPARGAIWDRATASWKNISVASAPTNRRGYGLAWTGGKVVLWGGVNTTGWVNVLSTGFLYDPVLDSWSPMTAKNPPQARQRPIMFWNGTQVVVWNGSSRTESPPTCCYGGMDGGLWDPVSNTWSSIPDNGAVDTHARALWAGNGLFVEGVACALCNNWFNAFWTPDAGWGAGCPLPPGQDQSLVWAGSELIWWGNLVTDAGVVPGGFRRAPGSCSYTPIPVTENAGPDRHGHSAVWTGTQMIVFGGSSDDGAAFDPIAGTWTPLIHGTPGTRGGHKAFWTGTEMVIWGGGTSDDPAGCVYRP